MFGGRSSDSSNSSSFDFDTEGYYACEYCHDKKANGDSMFSVLTECSHCGGKRPKAGSFFNDEDSSLEESFEEGYRFGDFTRGFIRGMTQVQDDPSESEDEDYDWKRETHQKMPREVYLRQETSSRREEIPNIHETNVIEQANAKECIKREQPQPKNLQENSETEVNLEEKPEKATEDDEASCKYCQQRFGASDQAISMTICGHQFHTHCMDNYLPDSKQCPTCNHHVDWTDVTKECVFCLENFRGWERDHVLACGHDCHIECSGHLTPQPKCPKCEGTYYCTGIQCSICLENISLAEETKKIVCQHEFHVGCLRAWLQDHTTCPLCRTQVNR